MRRHSNPLEKHGLAFTTVYSMVRCAYDIPVDTMHYCLLKCPQFVLPRDRHFYNKQSFVGFDSH